VGYHATACSSTERARPHLSRSKTTVASNFDWFAPANAHRQTPEQVRGWCGENGLVVERENVQEAGITIIAKKRR
jgi:hypothetical protein